MSDDNVTFLLFWDIDGTLLTTGRAGIFAWEEAASDAAGYPVNLQSLKTAGLTDFSIGRSILEDLGFPSDGSRLSRIVRKYEEVLPLVLPHRQGRVLDGVLDILEYVRANRPDLGLYLLTGNTPDGAKAKLTYYGLFDFFQGGAFADVIGDRTDIARRALATATKGRSVDLEHVFVIGDTPSDVACGRAIGAKTIAVATGEYQLEVLRAESPWRALSVLPDVKMFLSLLGEAD